MQEVLASTTRIPKLDFLRLVNLRTKDNRCDLCSRSEILVHNRTQEVPEREREREKITSRKWAAAASMASTYSQASSLLRSHPATKPGSPSNPRMLATLKLVPMPDLHLGSTAGWGSSSSSDVSVGQDSAYGTTSSTVGFVASGYALASALVCRPGVVLPLRGIFSFPCPPRGPWVLSSPRVLDPRTGLFRALQEYDFGWFDFVVWHGSRYTDIPRGRPGGRW